MGAIQEVMKEVMGQIEGSTATRYANLIFAFWNGVITREELNKVCFRELENQRIAGHLRTSRPVPILPDKEDTKYEESVRSKEIAIGQNEADNAWLEDLGHFIKEEGLSLSLKEQDWYDYIHAGKIARTVVEYLKYYAGDKEEIEVETLDNVPF